MRVNISSAVAEKGGGKVGCVAIHDCYSPLLHTRSWTVEENTCLGEEVAGPKLSEMYDCMQGAFPNGLAKVAPSACSAC